MTKKKILGAFMALTVVASLGSAVYAETFNASGVVVPNYGQNWYSASHYAPDKTATATVTTTSPANQNIYGTINNAQHTNISSEIFLPIGQQQSITHTANVGDPICIMLETSAFNGDNTTVSFGWTP